MNLSSARFKHIIAFDVGKDHLDVATLPTSSSKAISSSATIANNKRSVIAFLKKEIGRNRKQEPGEMLIVCEATGGYERCLLAACGALGLPVHRAEGRRVRLFAQIQGQRAKTDPLDAQMIALFAKNTDCSRLYEPPAADVKTLKSLVSRREELLVMKLAERARLDMAEDKLVRKTIRAMATLLARQLETLEEEIDGLIKNSARLNRKARLLRSLKGVGPITTMTLLATMPELGTLSKGQVAALAGLAPYNRDSGKTNRRRHITAGRFAARRCLYMAATIAIRHNPVFRKKFEDLSMRGKPWKVAIVAIMRKMIVTLNAILKSGEPWKGAKMT